MASASAPSAMEPAKDLILVHTVQLKPMIKAHSSVRVHSEKTHPKKLMMILLSLL